MKQVEETQKNYNSAKGELEKNRGGEGGHDNCRGNEDQAVEMEKRLKVSAQTEQELREHSDRLEKSFKEDIGRLDNLVKEVAAARCWRSLIVSKQLMRK